ncbi:MAG: hypothetical protein ACREJO_05135 [Phycisphaerales bacterium]
MSQSPSPSRPVNVVIQQPPRSNGFGITGFILSLVALLGGVCFGTLLSPLSLLLSIIGLRREPRGLAIAGTILSIIGIIWLAVWIIIFGSIAMIGLQGVGALQDVFKDIRSTEGLYTQVDAFVAKSGKVPTQAEVDAMGVLDTKGHPFRISVVSTGYTLFNSGFDGIPNNKDDLEVLRGGSIRSGGSYGSP